MKLVCISDNHNNYNDFIVPNGDVLIHAGDFSYQGKPGEIVDFMDWLNRQPHTHKLWIPGNHELSLEDFPYNIETIEKETSSVCLHNKEYTIDGARFFGAAFTPEFNHWAYNLTDRQSKVFWENAPSTDVLVSHGPPRDVLDTSGYHGRPLGCKYHFEYLKRTKPKINVFGHIHGSGGLEEKLQWDNGSTTLCANVSVLNEKYKFENEPTVLDVNI
jgi:Icc-related predicted phosphoesterase